MHGLSTNKLCLLGLSLFSLASCLDPVIENQPLTAEPISASSATLVPQAAGTKVQLTGIVKNAKTQALLAGVKVRLNTLETQTDQTGFFAFENLEIGEMKLIAEAPGYQPQAVTVALKSSKQVQDLALEAQPLPNGENPSTLTPQASSTPYFLPPDTLSSPSPTPVPDATLQPQASGLPSPTPEATVSATPLPTPSPTATPLYDPALDEAKGTDIFLKRKPTGIELNFMLFKLSGAPIVWNWGVVQVEYYLAQSVITNGSSAAGELITSGKSVLTQSNEPFTVPLDSQRQALIGETVFINYTLTLPNTQQLSYQKEVKVNL